MLFCSSNIFILYLLKGDSFKGGGMLALIIVCVIQQADTSPLALRDCGVIATCRVADGAHRRGGHARLYCLRVNRRASLSWFSRRFRVRPPRE